MERLILDVSERVAFLYEATRKFITTICPIKCIFLRHIDLGTKERKESMLCTLSLLQLFYECINVCLHFVIFAHDLICLLPNPTVHRFTIIFSECLFFLIRDVELHNL